MIQDCKYDRFKDIKKTIPNLAMSIEDAMTTGIISSTGTELPYTNDTEVSEIGSYLHDNIEIAMAAKQIGQSMSNLPTNTAVQSNPTTGENA